MTVQPENQQPPVSTTAFQEQAATQSFVQTVEELYVAQTGMSQIEMMKMLQILQDSEENTEKLLEAIVALESGDIQAAIEVLTASPAALSEMENQWVDPLKYVPETLTYSLNQSVAEQIRIKYQ